MLKNCKCVSCNYLFVNKFNSLIQIGSRPEVIFKIYFIYGRHDKSCNWTCPVRCVVYGLWWVIVIGFVYRLVGVDGKCVLASSSTYKLEDSAFVGVT